MEPAQNPVPRIASEPIKGLPTWCTGCVLLPCKHPEFLDMLTDWLRTRLARVPNGQLMCVDTFSQDSELSCSVPEWNNTYIIRVSAPLGHLVTMHSNVWMGSASNLDADFRIMLQDFIDLEMSGSSPTVWCAEYMGAVPSAMGVNEVCGVADLPLIPAHTAIADKTASRISFPYNTMRWTAAGLSVLGSAEPSCVLLRALYPHGMVFTPPRSSAQYEITVSVGLEDCLPIV